MKTLLLSAATALALAASAPAMAAQKDLEGAWDAQSPQTGGLAELDITASGSGIKVRAAAECSPRACEMGEVAGILLSPLGRNGEINSMTARFETKDASRQVIAQLDGRDRLKITMIQGFKDGRAGGARISTETFVRADDRVGSGGSAGSGNVTASCSEVSSAMRIRYDGGSWSLTSGSTVLGKFASPDDAGYARYLIQGHGFAQKCTIQGSGFEYWTTSSGSLPRDKMTGEYCTQLRGRTFAVRPAGGNFRIVNGDQTLYEVQNRDVADAIADTLTDKNAQSQCFVGEQGKGISYFLR